MATLHAGLMTLLGIQGHGVKGQGHMSPSVKLISTISHKGVDISSLNLTWQLPIRLTDKVFKVMSSEAKVICEKLLSAISQKGVETEGSSLNLTLW